MAVAGLSQLILVAIGMSLIVARTPAAPLGTAIALLVVGAIVGIAIAVGPGLAIGCGSGSDPSSGRPQGSFTRDAASLDWRLNCGNLDVSMTSDSAWKASVGNTAATSHRHRHAGRAADRAG